MGAARWVAELLGVVALSALLACPARTNPDAAGADDARLNGVSCEGLLSAAVAAGTLGHDVRYKETRHRSVRFQVVSCEHATKSAMEVFAFDVGCGSGAKERFVTVARSLEKAIRQTAPKVGEEAWASPNVYVAWHAQVSCYTTVLLSWRRPRDTWLRTFTEALRARVTAHPAGEGRSAPDTGVR